MQQAIPNEEENEKNPACSILSIFATGNLSALNREK